MSNVHSSATSNQNWALSNSICRFHVLITAHYTFAYWKIRIEKWIIARLAGYGERGCLTGLDRAGPVTKSPDAWDKVPKKKRKKNRKIFLFDDSIVKSAPQTRVLVHNVTIDRRLPSMAIKIPIFIIQIL